MNQISYNELTENIRQGKYTVDPKEWGLPEDVAQNIQSGDKTAKGEWDKANRQRIRAMAAEMYTKFKADLLSVYGLTPGEAKAEKFFDLAYQLGHSAGLHEVASFAEELSALL